MTTGAGLVRELHPREVKHQVGDNRAGAGPDHLGSHQRDHVTARPMTEQPGADGDRRVEVRRDGPEDGNDGHQNRPGGQGVLEKLESHIVGTEALGHDPRADHADEQEHRAHELRNEHTVPFVLHGEKP